MDGRDPVAFPFQVVGNELGDRRLVLDDEQSLCARAAAVAPARGGPARCRAWQIGHRSSEDIPSLYDDGDAFHRVEARVNAS